MNKNAIPLDPEKPFIASGIRIGTPAMTTRGLKEKDMTQVAAWINAVLTAPQDEKNLLAIRQAVKKLCMKHPMYTERLRA